MLAPTTIWPSLLSWPNSWLGCGLWCAAVFTARTPNLHYADLAAGSPPSHALCAAPEIIPLTTKEFALLELFLLHAPELGHAERNHRARLGLPLR